MALTDRTDATHDGLVRILFLTANPTGTAAVRSDRELKAVQAELDRKRYGERFAPIDHRPAAEWADLSRGLRRHPHIVHYAGHGERNGRLAFEDQAGAQDPVRLKHLRDFLAALGGGVRLVVLNACWSGDDAETARACADFVIGMARPVSDAAAIAFAEELYRGLRAGDNLRIAFEAAKVAMTRAGSAGIGRDLVDPDAGDAAATADVPRLFERAGADAGKFVVVNECWRGSPAGAEGKGNGRYRSNIPSRRDLPFVGRDEDLATVVELLGDTDRESVVVLHGVSGSGKSELAREVARRNAARYPGGTFTVDATAVGPPIGLATIGLDIFGLTYPTDLPLDDQCVQALLALGTGPTLLIYDNVTDAEAIRKWLPPAGMPCHVLITSVLDSWDVGWRTHVVRPLTPEPARELVEAIVGPELAGRFGPDIERLSGGLPMQILPQATAIAVASRHGPGRVQALRQGLTTEAASSFRNAYDLLSRQSRLLLHAAAFLNLERIPDEELYQHIRVPTDWTRADFDSAVDGARDLHLVDSLDGVAYRMHRLVADFVLSEEVHVGAADTLVAIRQYQANRLIVLAMALGRHPNETGLAELVTAFRAEPGLWRAPLASRAALPFYQDSVGDNFDLVGSCLVVAGQYEAARPWFEHAVADKERGDVCGRVDHGSLGSSMHSVGVCLSRSGEHEAARSWFERAAAEIGLGDVHCRVDHGRLGNSLYMVGACLTEAGQHEAARPWFERAVAEMDLGDILGRVDHDRLGNSLEMVGVCLAQTGQHKAARSWFERAVGEIAQGGVDGRVDHDRLGCAVHQVGYCLSQTGRYEAARLSYERAVAEKQRGNVHGRVNHDSLGSSLHQVGYCLAKTGQYEAARPWYERAVAEMELGDVHSRVDPMRIGVSLRSLAFVLRRLDLDEDATLAERRADALAGQSS